MDEIVCVLLADLHFGADFDREAELPPIEYSPLVNLLSAATGVNRFLRDRCQAHDLAVTTALSRYLIALFVQERENGFSGDAFDLFIMLGDIVTWPSAEAFRFAREYVTRESYGARRAGVPPHCAGLRVAADRLVLLPGNHDKLLRRDLESFYAGLIRPLGLADRPEPGGSYLVSKTIKGRELVFLLVDASIYTTEDNRLRLENVLDGRRHLACGGVSAQLSDNLRAKLDRLKRGEPVDQAHVDDYARAIKILVLHYAVDDASVRQGIPSFPELVMPHHCEGIDRLVDALNGEIRFALHGHLHQARRYQWRGLPVVSVPSATQRGASNGFYLLRIREDDIRAEHHRWMRTAFALDQSELSGPL